MIRLETVEDFEKVRKALDDPKSFSYQFCIKSFGFCTACNRLTEFDDDNSMDSCHRKCLSCKRIFKFSYDGVKHTSGECYFCQDEHEYFIFVSQDQNPRKEYEKLHSREYQDKLFARELEARIRKLKQEIRKSNNLVRRFAKLR